jgi:hypothetical protein
VPRLDGDPVYRPGTAQALAEQVGVGRSVGGSCSRIDVEPVPSPAARSISRATGSSGSRSRLMWVRKRLALTAQRKSGGVRSRHFDEGGELGQPVEGVVALDGGEVLGVVLQPQPLRQLRRVEAAAPVAVLPPRRPDDHGHGGRLPCLLMADAPARFKDLCLDARDHQALADWWCAALGYVRRDDLEPADDDPRPRDWPVPIVDPSGAGPLMWIVPVPEPKVVKNRMHFDVVGDRAAAGGRRHAGAGQDDEIEWDVLADPLLRLVGDDGLGGEEQRRDRRGVLQRRAGDLGRVDDAGRRSGRRTRRWRR